MRTCPACGEENPERARFCLACAAPLAEPVPAGEERKVVSVLFVDLVGFTAHSDRADPEDVRATLQPFHARLKREIERYGGRVEKFVGDAVMAVFGAPVAHEDDAERSVRAGLAALAAIEELNADAGLELAVRAAIDTGEALVSLGARPEAGEGFVAGDVVNTAARLQQTAPPGALVVGETTYRTTRDLIDYEPLEPVAAKGKADAVPRWLARGPRSRLEVDLPRASAAFVGRRDELELLQRTLTRALGEASVQLVTLTGEPGVGKSRLLAELRGFVEDRPELVFWRQGRCLPYGEGITFWALGEIVKAHAGILDSDDATVALAKLAAAVEAVVASDSEREWVEAQLRPLVGVETADPASVADRSESFAAWRSFLEAIAERRPLVLVLEDLHWADPALLDFVEHVVDWASGVPLLVVCTARPELYDLRPGWSGGKRNAAAIALEPLSDVETARLLAELLGQAVLPADLQSVLLERAGGNPLYAEEFARMLADRGLLERRALLDADTVAVPETVQAVIAARIDTLAPEHKRLLHDASVVGKVFWAGAVAAMAGLDEARVRQGLQELARKEFVRPVRSASIEGQAEYVFWHLLVRDVAYAQIPRAERATRHVAAAEWTEQSAGERVTDHAELLAYHYAEALELARAAGLAPLADELERRVPRFLALAGDRAFQLDPARALAYYDRALALLDRDDPQWPPVLRDWIRATVSSSALPLDGIAERMRGAIDELRAGGHVLEAAEVLGLLSLNRWVAGETDTAYALLDEALALAEAQQPGRTLAQLYASRASRLAIGGRDAEALEYAEKVLSLLEDAPLDAITIRSLYVRGMARCGRGDLGGLNDLREALRRAQEAGLGQENALAYTNLACWTWLAEGPHAGLELYRAGLDFARRRGLSANVGWMSAETTWCLYDSGDWDELLQVRDDVLELEQKLGRGQQGTIVRTSAALVALQRGRLDEARALIDESLPRARTARDPQVLVPALGAAALLASAAGDDATAAGLVAELPEVAAFYPATGRACIRAGRGDLVERLLSDGIPAGRREELGFATLRALLAEAGGELETAAALFEEAAAGWETYGHRLERAGCLVGCGRCLLGLRRRAEAAAALEQARAVFAALGATVPAAEADELLAEAFRLTS